VAAGDLKVAKLQIENLRYGESWGVYLPIHEHTFAVLIVWPVKGSEE
jgi:hypothetical protein